MRHRQTARWEGGVSHLVAIFGRLLGSSRFFRFAVLFLFSSTRRARLCQCRSSRPRRHEGRAALIHYLHRSPPLHTSHRAGHGMPSLGQILPYVLLLRERQTVVLAWHPDHIGGPARSASIKPIFDVSPPCWHSTLFPARWCACGAWLIGGEFKNRA
jgi:hypothetical protein